MVKYPTGVKMRNYSRRPIKRYFHRNKYHAHKIHADGHTFDSKVEYDYYLLLKAEGKTFRIHPTLNYRKRVSYISRVDGSKHYLRRRSYKPDFVIYDKHNNISEIVDIKGMKHIPSYDNMKFDDFSYKWHILLLLFECDTAILLKK